MKVTNFFSIVFLISLSLTVNANNYYPQEYQNAFANGSLTDGQLKEVLFDILASQHQTQGNRPDKLGCDSSDRGRCYGQITLGYKSARKVLFGKLHLEEDAGGYFVKDVYCRERITSHQTSIGPYLIPKHTLMNCEHTWPQSKFSSRFNKGYQKSDLHHLFPTNSKANSVRGNSEFTDLSSGNELFECEASSSEGGNSGRFEPPTEHKGNVARALFYFSTRYQIQISSRQERTLRAWHRLDPVDAEEMERNNQIFNIQHNRNPFIDYPQLVDQISNF